MNFIMNYLKGFAIGAGAILPGISSGVLCVIFGIYDKLINSVLGFFQNIKSNFFFLFPFLLGSISGIILLGNLLLYLFECYPIQTDFAFIGLIVGSIPLLLKQAHQNQSFRLSYLFYLCFSVFITFLLIMIEKNITYHVTNTNFLYLILCGFFMSIGVVVPGVSSTAILMCFGVYSTYLTSVSSLYLPVLIPMGIGLLLGGLLFLKIIQYLLKQYHIQTYYSIIGFVIGSVFMIYPGFHFDFSHIIGLLCCIIGFRIANLLEKWYNTIIISCNLLHSFAVDRLKEEYIW